MSLTGCGLQARAKGDESEPDTQKRLQHRMMAARVRMCVSVCDLTPANTMRALLYGRKPEIPGPAE